MILKIKYVSDPGHGWLVVKRKLLKELGIEDKISPFSYQSKSGKTVYAEEDGDAAAFLDAAKAKGIVVEFEEKYYDKIYVRSLPHYFRS